MGENTQHDRGNNRIYNTREEEREKQNLGGSKFFNPFKIGLHRPFHLKSNIFGT